MTPTELKVRALKKIEEAITKFMDIEIDGGDLLEICRQTIDEVIDEFI